MGKTKKRKTLSSPSRALPSPPPDPARAAAAGSTPRRCRRLGSGLLLLTTSRRIRPPPPRRRLAPRRRATTHAPPRLLSCACLHLDRATPASAPARAARSSGGEARGADGVEEARPPMRGWSGGSARERERERRRRRHVGVIGRGGERKYLKRQTLRS